MISTISARYQKNSFQAPSQMAALCDIALTAGLCLVALSNDWCRLLRGGATLSGWSVAGWLSTGANGQLLLMADRSTTPWPAKEGKGLIWSDQHVPVRALRQTPNRITPSQDEEQRAQNLNILDLVRVAQTVGLSSAYQQKLEDWLTDKVPNPKEYTIVGAGQEELACAQLNRHLRLILLEMDHSENPPSNDSKQRVLSKLVDHSAACSPTWLEVAEEGYAELKGATNLRQRLLQYVTTIKRDLIHEDLQSHDYFPGAEDWHLEKRVVHQAGRELGLPISEAFYLDSTVSHRPFEDREFRAQAFKFASDLFLKETFIQRVLPKLQMEAPGNGLDPEVTHFLCDGDAENWDFACQVYYTNVNGVYHLNEDGARKLLALIGYC
jgi:hypothetical protein